MFSGRGKRENAESRTPAFNAETGTQVMEDGFSSGENGGHLLPDESCLFQSTMHYDETLPMAGGNFTEIQFGAEANRLEGETQVFEDFETQVVEDLDFNDGGCTAEVPMGSEPEETGRTEELIEAEGVSPDMAVSSKVTFFSGKGEKLSEEVSSQKRHSIARVPEKEEVTVISGASPDEELRVGRAGRCFTSIRAAALRSTALAAARSMTLKSAHSGLYPTSNKTQALRDNCHTPPSKCGFIGKNNVSNLSDSPSFCDPDVCKSGEDNEGSIRGKPGNQTKSATVRKLFAVSPPEGNYDKESGIAYGAGLSYVNSQEPGQFSQNTALNVVEKYLCMHVMESSEEGLPVLTGELDDKSPPTSILKGRVSLAQSINPGKPAIEKRIFDWVDSNEDESGGEFFSKRKDALLRNGNCLGQSRKKSRRLKNVIRNTEYLCLQSGEKEHTLQIHQKLMDLVCPNTGFQVGMPKKCDIYQPLETKKKNLSNVNGSQDVCGVGFDTQLAADAMEALGFASHVDRDGGDPSSLEREISEGVTKKETSSRQIAKKRGHSTSTLGRNMRLLKQQKSHGRKLSYSRSKGRLQESAVKTGGRVSHQDHLEESREKSSHLSNIQRGHADNLIGKLDECNGSLLNGTGTPVAHRTRQSIAANPCKRAKSSSTDHGMVLNCSKKVGNAEEGKITLTVDVPGTLPLQEKISQLDSDQRTMQAKKRKGRMNTAEDHDEGMQIAKSAENDCVALSKGMETCQRWTEEKDKEQNDHLERSPKEKMRSASSLTVVSPVCMANDPQKQLSKSSPSRSSLLRELKSLHSIEAGPVPSLTDTRRRRDMKGVRVLLSNHLGEDITKQQKKIMARLGVMVASSPSDATHFIADEFVRTRNMLEAMALGTPVVTHLWLESCAQASCYIDERNYVLRDHKKEKEIGFNMTASLSRAIENPLLRNKRVFMTPNVKPSRVIIAALVSACQGQALERLGRSAVKDHKIPNDLLILSCEEDYASCIPLLEKGAEVYNSELLLSGIVIQKLEYERHLLFTGHVRRTRSTIWLRNERGHQLLPVPRCT